MNIEKNEIEKAIKKSEKEIDINYMNYFLDKNEENLDNLLIQINILKGLYSELKFIKYKERK